MNAPDPQAAVLRVSDRVTLLPVVHGSADSAMQVRSWLLDHEVDCLAVPLPDSFREQVCEAVSDLPTASIVMQKPNPDWSRPSSENEDSEEPALWSYVPIDPCQPVIMAIRSAMGEHLPIHFVDLETDSFEPFATDLPDPYALKKVSIERFAAACLPSLPRPASRQVEQRLNYMACQLRRLEQRYQHVVMLCGIQDWPWLREAYMNREAIVPENEETQTPQRYSVDPRTLFFLLGELPFLTGLYERARQECDDDQHLSIDGVKQLLISARSSYLQDLGKRARRITPLLLSQCLKYIRNLTLLNRRFTPDLYTLAVACKQILGDQYTIHLMNTAREYPFQEEIGLETVKLGIDRATLPDDETVTIVSRLPGPPLTWHSLELQRQPEKLEQQKWESQWNPYNQCSWPPEDECIESFRTRVVERARAILGADLARTEKFSTSMQDGIDIRETLRHWYDGDIYVKVLPPSIGTLDCCVMLFDSPADPAEYPWRTTWYAEHKDESTLAFFATDFSKEMVGPGIALASYGGAMFLYPPVPIPDVWRDPALRFANSLEERLVAAACKYSRSRQIALLASQAPNAILRKAAKRFHKRLVHVPLAQFNDALIKQLRMVHVLNGKEVRSYASHFIRKA